MDKTFENEQKLILSLNDDLNDAINTFGSVVPENFKILEFVNKMKQYFETDDNGESPVYCEMWECFEDYDY